MLNIDDIIVSPHDTIHDVLNIIDSGKKQIALILDEKNKLIGTINDGDIRRAILKGKRLEDSIDEIYCKEPTIAKFNNTKEEIVRILTQKKIHQIPIVDEKNRVIGIDKLDDLLEKKEKPNQVILMVGGLGTRLRPLTENIPKPMLEVGNRPILQTIIEKFASFGFVNITLCVNYKSEIIRDYFGDGKDFGVNIDYVLEDKRMGTAGALSLLKNRPTSNFFVMNGDLLTNVNFENLLNFHIENNALATMCVRKYDFQVPYGVVNLNESQIVSIEEKPLHEFFVNAGIYALSPEILDHIPANEFFDMPTLFDDIISKKKTVNSFPIREYWLDIGHIEEYEKAKNEYYKVF